MLEFMVAGFLASAILTVILTPVVRASAPALGLIDLPGERKVHVQPTPRGGGIAIFLGVLIPTIVLLVVCVAGPAGRFAIADEILEELRWGSPLAVQLLAIAAGAIVLFLTGLADDRWNLSWKLRLGLQLSVAVGVVLSGVRATVFVSQPGLGSATVLWIIVLTNAMNFLDNMDALSAGIGLIASAMFAAILLFMVRSPTASVAFPLALLAGALSGFLVWNRPPATIFMGDRGK
ncbi:MAG: MraY family glycosyltransferase [Planctomycetaceae bacterium]